ncbi:MAG: ParB N-terminal domain-containing protein [Pseudomonadota bacterium]
MSVERPSGDIDMPDLGRASPDPAVDTEGSFPRPGCMGSGTNVSAEALEDRALAVEAIRAENDALALEYQALKEAGQVIRDVPLEEVHTYLLVRDRVLKEDVELEDLITSIKEVGLSNPIRVVTRPGGGYELVQGYRRLSAYRRLAEDQPGGPWGTVPALILPGKTDIAGLYRRMVDENVIRKDLSFAEMARAAQAYAADPATEADTLKKAVGILYKSAAYSKRSYIRSFAYMLDRIGPHLAYPTEIPRKLGVDLARALEDEPAIATLIKEELEDWGDMRTIRDELDVLARYAREDARPQEVHLRPARRTSMSPARKATTTFHITSRAGQIRCTASDGQLVIRVGRDFSTIDRRRLEEAVASLVDRLS